MRRKRTIRGLTTICLAVTWAVVAGSAPAGAQDHPTFARDVAPIVQQNCQICHQPGPSHRCRC